MIGEATKKILRIDENIGISDARWIVCYPSTGTFRVTVQAIATGFLL